MLQQSVAAKLIIAKKTLASAALVAGVEFLSVDPVRIRSSAKAVAFDRANNKLIRMIGGRAQLPLIGRRWRYAARHIKPVKGIRCPKYCSSRM
jgi:hypothetical protein